LGAGSTVGRLRTLPSVLVSSWLVTGLGATKLTGPSQRIVVEREDDCVHEVVERDPTEILFAVADDAADAHFDRHHHERQRAVVLVEHDAEPHVDDANAFTFATWAAARSHSSQTEARNVAPVLRTR
jgi:hypothetical protein